MAETITYTYNTGSDPTTSWTNPSRAYDGFATTYANRAIAASTNETDKYLLFSGHTGTSIPNWQITKVEIGVRRQDNGGASVHCEFKPVFGGSSDGPTHALSRTSTLSTVYIDITSDAGAPSPWTNTDIQNLDVKVWGNNSSASALNTRIAEVYVRITYRALYYAKLGTVITDDEFNSGSLSGSWTESFRTGGSYAFDVNTNGTICLYTGEGTINKETYQPSYIYQGSISGDFSIEMKFASYTVLSGALYGLVVEIDSTHYYFLGSSGGGTGYFYSYNTGFVSASSSGEGQIIYIKAVRSSSNVTLYRSSNGTTWTALTTRAIGSGNCKIGIICNCGVGDGGNGNCEIDYIRNSVSIQPTINIYRDNTDMTHYLAMRVAGETLYALASTVGEANESALRVRIDGTTYSIKTQR